MAFLKTMGIVVKVLAPSCLYQQKRNLGQVVDVRFVGLTFSPLRCMLTASEVQRPRKRDDLIAHINPPASAETGPIARK
jgi:hypothetical protein